MSESRTRAESLPLSRPSSAGATRRTTMIRAASDERHVDQEQRLPADQTHQQPADDGSDGGRRGVGHLDAPQRPGGLMFGLPASAPTMTTALGYAVAVPSAMSARATQTQAKFGEKGASAQVTATSAMPS